MDPNGGDRRAAALERILEISPVAPPSDSIEEFQAIASEFGLEREELAALIEEFLDHHGIDPEGPPPIAILRSGYQVLAEGDDGDVMDSLVNGVVGESIQAASEGQPDWDDWFARLHDAFAKEVEHATRTVHVDTARALLRELLARRVYERSDELIRGAFPHLRAGAAIRDAMEDFVPALKQGAVLILGKDSDEGLELLHRISDLLEQRHQRAPLLLKDQQDHDQLGLVAKLLINTAAARWVLIENTFPSGHLYELPFVEMAGAVVVVLQEEGHGASFMPGETMLKNVQWQRFRYRPETLEAVLSVAVEWAETTVAASATAHRSARPWRETRAPVD